MFQIVGQENFKQWDLNQLVTCDCMKPGDDVVFKGYGKVYETTAFEQGGKVVADVPNFLLQKAGSFEANLGWGLNCHLDCRTTFVVEAREKPADYVCPYNIKQRSSSEIPFFDLVEMGLPSVKLTDERKQTGIPKEVYDTCINGGLVRLRIAFNEPQTGVDLMFDFCGYPLINKTLGIVTFNQFHIDDESTIAFQVNLTNDNARTDGVEDPTKYVAIAWARLIDASYLGQ